METFRKKDKEKFLRGAFYKENMHQQYIFDQIH